MNIVDKVPVNKSNKSKSNKDSSCSKEQVNSRSNMDQTDSSESTIKEQITSSNCVDIVNSLIMKEKSKKCEKKQKNKVRDNTNVKNKKNFTAVETEVRDNSKKKNQKKLDVVEYSEYVSTPKQQIFVDMRLKDACEITSNGACSGTTDVCVKDIKGKKYKIVTHKHLNICESQEDGRISGDPSELLYSLPHYNGKLLPNWMLKISMENIPHVLHTLGNLYSECTFEKNDKANQEHTKSKKKKKLTLTDNMRECFRQHKLVLAAYNDRSENAKFLLRDYFFNVFKDLNPEFSEAMSNKKPPTFYLANTLPEIYVNDFDSTACNTASEADKIKLSSNPNFMFDKACDTAKCKAYTTMSLKSRLKDFALEGHDPCVWEHYLCKHMKLPESYQQFMDGDYIMWWKNFVPVSFYYLYTENWQRFYNLLMDRLHNLRNRILEYSFRYQKISVLPNYERKEYFETKRGLFRKMLQTPKAQAMFAIGYSKQDVSSIVYKECTNMLNNEMDRTIATKTEGKTYAITRIDEYDSDDCIYSNKDLGLTQKTISSKKLVSLSVNTAKNHSLYVRFFKKPTLDDAFEVVRENWEFAFETWLKLRHDYNKNFVVPILGSVRPFFQCATFEVFLLSRSYQTFQNLKSMNAKRYMRLESWPQECLDNLCDEDVDDGIWRPNGSVFSYMFFVLGQSIFSVFTFFQIFFAIAMTGVTFLVISFWDRVVFCSQCVATTLGVTRMIQAVDCREEVYNISHDIINFQTKGALRERAIELHSLVQIFIALRRNDKQMALAWSANIVVIRYNQLPTLLKFINDHKISIGCLAVGSIATVKYFSHDLDVGTYRQLCSYYDKSADLEEVDQFCKDNHAESVRTEAHELANFLRPFIGFFVGNEIKNLSAFEVRDLNQQWQLSNHMSRNYENMIETASNVITFLLRLIFGYDPFDRGQQEYMSRLMSMMVVFKNVIFEQQIIKTDKMRMLEVMQNCEVAMEIRKHPRFAGVTSYIAVYYDKLMTEFVSIAKECNHLIRCNKLRHEPICVLFTGPPKTGKSVTCNFLMQALSVLLFKKPYDSTMTFIYNKRSEFWEGYNQNTFVLMDDLFCSNDANDRRLEGMALIGMINSAPYNLPMAFETKGTAFFDSSYVFCSTNLMNSGIDHAELAIGVTDPRAVKRRFHWVLHKVSEYKGEAPADTFFRVDGCPAEYENDFKNRIISSKTLCRLLYEQKLNQKEPTVLSVQDIHAMFPDMFDSSDVSSNDMPDLEDIEEIGDVQSESKSQMFEQLFSMKDESTTENDKEPLGLNSALLSPDQCKYFDNYYTIFIKDNKDSIFKGVAYAAGLFVALITAYGMYNVYSSFDSKEDVVEVESHNKQYAQQAGRKMGWTNKDRQKAAILRKYRRYRTMKHKPNFMRFVKESAELNFQMAALKAAKGSVALFMRGYNENGEVKLQEASVGFHLKDGFILTVAHAILKFEEFDRVQIFMKHNSVITEIDTSTVMVFDSDDACLLKMPKDVNRPPEMYKYLASSEVAYNLYDGMTMKLVTCTMEGEPYFKSVNKISGLDDSCCYSVGDTNIVVEQPIYYRGHTEPGDSGSMLFMSGQQGQPILIGMHIGSQGGDGRMFRVAIPIWKEYLDGALQQLQTESSNFPHAISYEVPMDRAFNRPKVSKIKRSPFFGVFGEPIYVPAHLTHFHNRDGELIDPAMNGLLKLRQQDFDAIIPQEILSYLLHLYPPAECRDLFDYDAVVNGRSDLGVPSIKVSTSPGYPYCLAAKKGKTDFVKYDGVKFIVDPNFISKVKEYEAELLRGERIEVIWADVLKDETRPVEKVDQGKTRLFSTCPLHYLFLVRRYFGAFVAELHRHSVNKPVAVGINPHSLDWERLHNRLASKGKSIVAGDFENYDGSLCSAFAKFYVKFVNAWYDDGPVNARVRELLFQEIWNSKHIFGMAVYELAMGNPSGNPNTADYNSIANIAATVTVLTKDLNLRYDEFELTVYGDDNVIAISREGIRCSDLAPHYLRRFGMKYTHFTKAVAENEPYDTLATIRYLGRAFCRVQSVIKAPLELRTILEMIYWYRGSDGKEEKILSTLEAYAIELSHHGEEEFNKYIKLLNQFVKARYNSISSAVERRIKNYWYYHEGMYDAQKFVKFVWFESKTYTTLFNDYDELALNNFNQISNLAKCAITESSIKHPPEGVKLECRDIPVSFEVEQRDNEDRDANVAVDTQEGRIGNFADVSVVDHSKSSLGSVLNDKLNFEEYTVDQILERTYEVLTIPWNESQSFSLELGQITMPKALFVQPFIANRIKDFYYFKATVRFSFRLSSSKYVYGMLIVSANPFPTTNIHDSNAYLCSGLPHVLLSASESSTCVLDVPFVSDKRALMINNHFADEMCRVKIRVLAPLRNTDGTTASATLTVFAQFLDAKLAGPYSFTTESRTEASLKGKMASISSTFDDKVAKPIRLMRNKVDKTVSPFLETAEKVGAVINTLATVASIVGLDKPVTTDRNTTVVSIPDVDLMSGNGISHAVKVGYDVDNAVATAPICSYPGDEMNLLNIVSTPMISSVITMVSGTVPLPICLAGVQIDSGGPFRCTYLDWVANQFLFVSGSIKYKIYITAGLFQAIRLVFYLAPDQFTNVEWENCYHKVVDVQGDTQVDFTLPYMTPYVVDSTRFPSQTPCVWVKILGWSTPNPTVSAPITLIVYKAGDKDMQFGCPLEKSINLESNPRVDFAKDFAFLHDHMTNYKHDGIVFGENLISVRDIVHRLAPYHVISPTETVKPYDTAGMNGQFMHLEMWGQIFKFYRGSIRVAFLGKSNNQVSAVNLRTPNAAGYPNYWLPFAKFGDKNMGILQVEVPWYCSRPYIPTAPTTTGTETHPLEVCMCSTEKAQVLKGAGDDFSFGFLMPPLEWPHEPSGSIGVSALRSYYDN